MAIGTPTNKITSAGSTANASAYDTAVVTLTAGRWYTLQTSSYGATSHTVSSVIQDPLGTPLNFTLVSDGTTSARNQNWDAATHRILEVWAVNPASTTANAKITITFSGTQSAACWSLTEWATGVDPTTFATKVATSVDAGAGTTASLTMAAFANSVNATFWVIGLGTGIADPAENVLIGESRTELTEIDDAERSQHAVHYQNPNGSDTSLTATWTNNEEWGTIGIEVKAQSNDATATSAMTIVPSVASDETETFNGTSALAVVVAVVAAAMVANPVTATSALTIVPNIVAAATETINSTGALTVVPTVVAAGTETISGTSALTVAPSVAGASSETISSGAVLTIAPSVVSAGTESLSGTAVLTIIPSVVGAESETISSTAALSVVGTVVGACTVTGGGGGDATGTGALVIAPSVTAAGSETISSAAALAIVPSVVTAGTETLSATGALTVAPVVVGTGTQSGASGPEGSADLVVSVSVVATGHTWMPTGSVPNTYLRWRFRLSA